MTIAAVMQPYFLSYPGYYRLMAATDVFVIFDCVQFPRRGWVHRNRLQDQNGTFQHLTLPIAKAPQSVCIKDLLFTTDADERMRDQLNRFPALKQTSPNPLATALINMRPCPGGKVIDYLEEQMRMIADSLNFGCTFVRSSTLGLANDLCSSARVQAAAHAVGASTYLNSPGGRDLYDPEVFASNGLDLRFLPPWDGPFDSILSLLMTHHTDEVSALIKAHSLLCR